MQICEGGRLVRDDFLCDPTGFAQLTPEQRARMRTIGACWNDDIVAHRAEMVALYSPLAAGAPKAAKVVRDIAYGPDARQVLDIFCPDGQAGARPVVVFIHGGRLPVVPRARMARSMTMSCTGSPGWAMSASMSNTVWRLPSPGPMARGTCWTR
ncbi:hypothetical protein [Gluconacetobacter tumulicola]|uniref:hypothetical protein n=1 Tax=Gluconacetobacter tumulicola TaxID=1017177 RepID=UPI001FE812D1|nr:hypothetical protein [Gluconacetobacter tumulicola]